MRLPRKWVLSLGLLATAPGLVRADSADKGSAAPASSSNQQVAQKIGSALKAAGLKGKGVQLEYKSGTCTISGEVADPRMRAMATSVISKVDGVQSVDNRLKVAGGAPASASGIQQAAFEGGSQPVQRVNAEAPVFNNQQVAQNIADALSSAGLSGYDIEVRFKNGIASMAGNVDSPDAAQKAYAAASSVEGVQQVASRLTVNGRPAPAQRPAVMPAGYPQQQMQMSPQMAMQQQAMMQQAAMQRQMAMAPQQAYGTTPTSMQMPMGGMPPGAPGMGPSPMGGPGGPVQPAGHHMMYNQPNVPQYAWPSYAPPDNSAAITYPSQYDASAWPYIGPYYPYPQVPLGWRKATLEWDDGSWNLKFNSRTDRWWWFMNPHNWSE